MSRSKNEELEIGSIRGDSHGRELISQMHASIIDARPLRSERDAVTTDVNHSVVFFFHYFTSRSTAIGLVTGSRCERCENHRWQSSSERWVREFSPNSKPPRLALVVARRFLLLRANGRQPLLDGKTGHFSSRFRTARQRERDRLTQTRMFHLRGDRSCDLER